MLGWQFICPIGPATEREFILDWRILKNGQFRGISHFKITTFSRLNGIYQKREMQNYKHFDPIVRPLIAIGRRPASNRPFPYFYVKT